MKRSIHLTQIAILIAVIISSGCRQNESPVTPLNKKQLYLSEISNPEETIQSFRYDDQDRLSGHVTRDGDVEIYFKYVYGNNRWPRYIKAYYDGIHRMNIHLTYQEGLLVRSKAISVLGNLMFDDAYEYDKMGRIIRLKQAAQFFGTPVQREYIWEDENVKKIIASSPGGTRVFEFEYDAREDRFNPFMKVFAAVGFDHVNRMPLTRNNWTVAKFYYKGFEEEAKFYYSKYSYVYEGYPYYVYTESKDDTGTIKESKLNYHYISK